MGYGGLSGRRKALGWLTVLPVGDTTALSGSGPRHLRCALRGPLVGRCICNRPLWV